MIILFLLSKCSWSLHRPFSFRLLLLVSKYLYLYPREPVINAFLLTHDINFLIFELFLIEFGNKSFDISFYFFFAVRIYLYLLDPAVEIDEASFSLPLLARVGRQLWHNSRCLC